MMSKVSQGGLAAQGIFYAFSHIGFWLALLVAGRLCVASAPGSGLVSFQGHSRSGTEAHERRNVLLRRLPAKQSV